MGSINVGRVILGGLLAGLIINVSESILNVFVVAEQTAAAMENLGLPPLGGGAIGTFVLFGFLIGIAAVWVYAAVRPRLGPGPGTAVIAGALVWFLAYLWPGVGDTVSGLIPAGFMITYVIWGLVEMIVATLAGAWAYKEV